MRLLTDIILKEKWDENTKLKRINLMYSINAGSR
jgi:hypothetical protein